MKITKEQIISFVLLLLRLCWPATVLIGLCTGMFLAFDPVLLWLDQVAPWFIGGAWLSLLIIYILLGVAFILFSARRLRCRYGSEAVHVQGRMAVLSGLPFYAICLFFLMTSIYTGYDPNVSGAGAFFSVAGFFGFVLISLSYLLLLFFFLGLKKQLLSFVLLFIRLYWPATVFIGVCTGILFVFNPSFLLYGQLSPWFIGGGWLLLLPVYILLGVAFTFFFARLLRGRYGSEAVHVQGRMAVLSGLPFYTICLLFLMMSIEGILVSPGSAFFNVASFFGFALISLSYLLLLFFFLGLLRSAVVLMSNWRIRKN
ncbi:MAG: hypothetical protein JO011_04255 [Ktedonobacteraceae bacterium]|nr:hypothetical protein [Ktedonobacteraceae bacterium]